MRARNTQPTGPADVSLTEGLDTPFCSIHRLEAPMNERHQSAFGAAILALAIAVAATVVGVAGLGPMAARPAIVKA